MRTDQKLFCLKTLLSIFLSILWLVAAAIFGILLWLRLDYWTNEYLEIDSELDRYLVLVYLTLAAGAVLAVFSLFGLIGACIKSKWLLVIYLTSVVLAMCLTISSVVYGSIYRDELERTLVKNDLLQDVIKKKYIDDDRNQITRAIDIMQSELECCGGEGPLDYAQAVWTPTDPSKDVEVPASCCKRYLQHKDRSRTCYMYVSDTDREKSEDVWQNGCKKNLQEFLDTYVIVIISIAAVYFLLQLICMIQSPYPSRGDYRDYYH
ncbi:hypothetical protein EGW08_007143 [Elysia chlorotica]|uniref:Tetraspanin n=1 Tax=Elysia chlorotica TaxID=188477 RepID=A0A433TU51_ELYCH|nr:hypothetical protein EGW08_007143 [Elysia chlorotica]